MGLAYKSLYTMRGWALETAGARLGGPGVLAVLALHTAADRPSWRWAQVPARERVHNAVTLHSIAEVPAAE